MAASTAIDAHLRRGGLDDGLIYDAVRVRLIEIGEAVKDIDPDLLAAEAGTPWDCWERRVFVDEPRVDADRTLEAMPPGNRRPSGRLQRVRGFAEQLLHYFDRPSVGVPTGPVGGPAAWTASTVGGEWRETLGAGQVAELRRAVEAVAEAGRPTSSLTVDDVPLPTWTTAVERWRRELADGRGFVLVRGLPTDWSLEQAEVACWAIGLHLGDPGAQNLDGDLLGHVRDEGPANAHADERLYRTNQEIRFHCDAADVVGLYCRSTSMEGGASRLVSSVTVHDRLRAEAPDLADRLFEPMALDARQPEGSALPPTVEVTPAAWDGARLRTFMHLDYFTSATRHPGVELDDRARRALEAWERIAQQPGIHLDMQLAPGDLQLVSNHTVVHARTSYRDDPSSPRDLLRLWLSLDRAGAHPTTFEEQP